MILLWFYYDEIYVKFMFFLTFFSYMILLWFYYD